MNLITAILLVSAQAANVRTPFCNAHQIALTTDSQHGDFDGMSHSGTLLVLRNHGAANCSVLPKPRFNFTDKSGQRVALDWSAPPGLHPGPVQIPVNIPAGGVVTARARWVSNEVYTQNMCVDTAFISLSLGKTDGRTAKTRLEAHVCGPAGKPITYTLEPFHLDTGYKPSPTP